MVSREGSFTNPLDQSNQDKDFSQTKCTFPCTYPLTQLRTLTTDLLFTSISTKVSTAAYGYNGIYIAYIEKPYLITVDWKPEVFC